MSLVKLKNNVITYTVNKSKISNCYISIQNGEVIVSAPWYLNTNQIQNMVEEKRQWIIEKLNNYNPSCKLKNNINNSIKILGKDYYFKILYKNTKGPSITLEEDKIKIILPNKYKNTDIKSILKILFEKMYYNLAEKEIEMAMEKVRITLGFAPEDYKICKMKNILGKCTDDKTILINPDIVMFNKNIIEYVITHEFCHLKYKNHTKQFYNLLKKYIPNYTEYSDIICNYKY